MRGAVWWLVFVGRRTMGLERFFAGEVCGEGGRAFWDRMYNRITFVLTKRLAVIARPHSIGQKIQDLIISWAIFATGHHRMVVT